MAIDHASAESDSAYQALHDPLTQLPNRALIVDRISQAMARLERDGTSLSVLLVDIDRFKAVNDMRGVDVGDRVLIEVADRLLAAVRLGDTVGRISSDQYLVMCVATNGELDAASVARRILRSLADPIRIPDGEDLHITASIGAVVVTEADADHSPAEVISNAESALATATSVGRGQFAMFEAEHQHDVVRRHEIEQALRNAILNDELVLHYQPLVEVRSGFMIGAEALVRWERPGHGLIPPDEFIGVAEDAGLIVPLEEWVIDRVCADLATWPKVKGRSAMVSINLSARHLEVDTLVPTVIRALQRNDLKPNRVGFEITESMAILDTEAALQNLEKLAALGCRIAIDDFGIGHASLDYLRRFSMASAIKIDRSFVAGPHRLNRGRGDRQGVDWHGRRTRSAGCGRRGGGRWSSSWPCANSAAATPRAMCSADRYRSTSCLRSGLSPASTPPSPARARQRTFASQAPSRPKLSWLWDPSGGAQPAKVREGGRD